MEEHIKLAHRKDWYIFLFVQKLLVEKYFDWLIVNISNDSKSLIGKGIIKIDGKEYEVLISYSPFYSHRYDRIYIKDPAIKYNNDIHLYKNLALCLYHPVIDMPVFRTIPLFEMIPWISEWIISYEQWKIYGVWLGKEIKH